MRTALQRAAFLSAIALALVAALAQAQSTPMPVPTEVALDIDHDGTMDRAVFVDDGATASSDLTIYLGVGSGKLDPARKPAIVKKAVLRGLRLRFEATAKGSLIVKAGCGGCSNDYATTLTIVYRHGTFWVGGVTYDWETRSAMGSCDIDFLSGKGRRSDGLNGKFKPVSGRFVPIKLADWTEDKRPKACD